MVDKTAKLTGKCCATCKHFKSGPMRVGGYRLGRCMNGKPKNDPGIWDQFEDNGGNCPAYASMAP